MLSLQMKSLDQHLMSAYRTELSVFVKVGEMYQLLIIDHVNSRRQGREITVCLRGHCGTSGSAKEQRVQSVPEAFALAKRLLPSDGRPILRSVYAGGSEINELARQLFAETFAVQNDAQGFSGDVLQFRKELLHEAIFSQLKNGPEGIENWNRSPRSEKEAAGITLEKIQLVNADLTAFNGEGMNAEKASFDGSRLPKASFVDAKLTGATFRKCDLEGANFSNCWSNNVDYSSANLKSVYSYDGTFKKCNYTKADLSGARFIKADFCGANFTDANMSDVSFEDCKFDEKTIFPPSLTNTYGLQWKGKGKNPLVDVGKLNEDANVDNFDDFVQHLHEYMDESKLDKALTMLRKDRFRLFSELSPFDVCGIVKSQTDADLVYACWLDSEGNYSCCSQNLNVCGGLKGSLCKHLLVLLIGLAKGGSLNYSQAAQWSAASKAQNPRKLDKEAMTALFLRYQGAETGEVDWRPTETIPEDFYAY